MIYGAEKQETMTINSVVEGEGTTVMSRQAYKGRKHVF
jgi:hypothetical protein